MMLGSNMTYNGQNPNAFFHMFFCDLLPFVLAISALMPYLPMRQSLVRNASLESKRPSKHFKIHFYILCISDNIRGIDMIISQDRHNVNAIYLYYE